MFRRLARMEPLQSSAQLNFLRTAWALSFHRHVIEILLGRKLKQVVLCFLKIDLMIHPSRQRRGVYRLTDEVNRAHA
jgi:hypothetical protein